MNSSQQQMHIFISLAMNFAKKFVVYIPGIVLVAGTLFSPLPAAARITRIVISRVESPTFDGKVFDKTGTYEKLYGRAYGEIDPANPLNRVITDITLAPRNSRGMVEYSMDIYLLKPVNLANGNHKLFLEVNNRGGKLFGGFNNSSGGNDPVSAADAGEGFLMNLGYSIAWNGWDISALPAGHNLTITVPTAKNADGSVLTGPSYEYIVFDNATAMSYKLAYPAATLDKSGAALTVRKRNSEKPELISANEWEYTDERTIRLLPAGKAFRQSDIYEFSYIAKDPLVAGLGLAATRDFVSFLRYAQADDFGYANPLANDLQFTFAFAVSQPARYLNDFQTLGFNADEKGKRVLDGIENWLGGASGVGINFRFAQPGRTERNRQNHLYPEAIFPFAFPVLSDPFSGQKTGRLASCLLNNTCPKAFEINSSNEYWVKAASLLHTDMQGNDLPDPDNVRFFLISGTQHGSGNATSRGICQQLQNPTKAEPALRALFIALDEWVTRGIQPPESMVPRRSDNNSAPAFPKEGSETGTVSQEALGWPDIPGVTYNGLITTRYNLDFGNSLAQGILVNNPPVVKGRPVYPNFVSRVDKDGNELAGIRLPPVSVPVATLTGWALRREGFAENEGCESAGQYIPFRITKEERLATKDPRLSLQERYGSHEDYVNEIRKSAQKLMSQRLLLKQDVQKYIDEAIASNILK